MPHAASVDRTPCKVLQPLGGYMDKLDIEKNAKNNRFVGKIRAAVDLRRKNKTEAVYDLIVVIIGFLFSRTHVVFGAHPLGIAYLSLLPSRVWIATFGAVLGALTLGKSGVIYAMISVIVVFLRVIISGTADEKSGSFSEGLILRMSASVIGGFVASVYEVLLSGFGITTILFGLSMILIPPIVVFGASGLFEGGPSLLSLFTADSRILSAKKEGEEKYAIIFYQCSALFAVFVVSFALREYNFIGISLGYLFAAFVTLVVGRRFGSVRGMAVGFASALSLSPTLTAGFALLGLVSGFLFKIGLVYALVGGGVALALWSFYSSEAVGLLSTLPEYMIAALSSIPLVKRLDPEKTETEGISAEREITDMIGTVALSYKNKYTGALDNLSLALSGLSAVVAGSAEVTRSPDEREIRALVSDVAHRYLIERIPPSPDPEKIPIPEELIEKMTYVIMKNGKPDPKDFDEYPSLSQFAEGICDTVGRAASILREEKFRLSRDEGYAEYLDAISRMLAEARATDEKEKSPNEELSMEITAALSTVGLLLGSGKAFGFRRPHFIIAAEDESGRKISSPEFKTELEGRTNLRLGGAEFYRRGNMALMECTAMEKYTVSAAFSGEPRSGESVSGDTVRLYDNEGGYFSALICDGAGSGDNAERASRFVADFLSSAPSTHNTLSLVNHILRHRGEEFATAVDLFTLDLYTGDAYFLKSGASTSYVKRGGSIFRIKSRTAPLGTLKRAECEKIRVEIEDGDILIMTSDGFAGGEDQAWIYELLAKEPPEKLSVYADMLLTEAKKHTPTTDDMTVAIVKITKKPIGDGFSHKVG